MLSGYKSISEITSKIIEIENSDDLFKWKIGDIWIWEIIRPKIYSQIIMSNEPTNGAGAGSAKKGAGTIAKSVRFFLRSLSAIAHHPYLDFNKTSVILFESSRKLLFQGVYIDPYTKFLCDELESSGISVSRYQSSYSFDRLAKRPLRIKHLDLPYMIAAFKSSFTMLSFTKEQHEKIVFLEQSLKDEFGIGFNLTRLIEKEIKAFRNNALFFDGLFKRKKPKEIYLVNFCDKSALIAMAKKNKIRVTDVQHGLISEADIIYHYPLVKEGSLNYFPDRFYAWSDIWKSVCRIPLEKENIITYGNKYLEHQRQNYAHIKKNAARLLVISQPGLTNEIAQEVIRNSAVLDRYDVLYKLHPTEYGSADRYPGLKQLRQQGKVTFVDRKDDLYELLAGAGTVLGVYSTALLEAMDFNCEVIVLNLPGAEMMKPFMDHSRVLTACTFFKAPEEKLKLN